MRFRVLVEQDAAIAAEVAAAHAAHTARCEYAPWRAWINAGRPGSERSQRAQAAAAEKARKVEAGEWVFSRADLVRAELAALIGERGWRRHRWRPVPTGAAEAPGRRWGVTTREYGGVVHVDVDDRTGDLLRRVAYWTSQRATEQLQQFVDRHGRGPAQVPDLAPAVQWLGLALTMMRLPTGEQLRERERWQRQVVTTADILREAIYRAGAGYEPPPARPEQAH